MRWKVPWNLVQTGSFSPPVKSVVKISEIKNISTSKLSHCVFTTDSNYLNDHFWHFEQRLKLISDLLIITENFESTKHEIMVEKGEMCVRGESVGMSYCLLVWSVLVNVSMCTSFPMARGGHLLTPTAVPFGGIAECEIGIFDFFPVCWCFSFGWIRFQLRIAPLKRNFACQVLERQYFFTFQSKTLF